MKQTSFAPRPDATGEHALDTSAKLPSFRRPTMAEVDCWFIGLAFSAPCFAGSMISFLYYGAIIWGLASIAIRRYPVDIPPSARVFVNASLAYAFVMLFTSVANDRFSGIVPGLIAGAAFYGVPVFISRLRHSNPQAVFEFMCLYAPVGALLGLLAAVVQVVAGTGPAEGGAGNASVFGFSAAVLGGISLANVLSENRFRKYLAIAGFAAGMCALILSRTRALYPVMVFAPALLLLVSRGDAKMRLQFVATLLSVTVFGPLFFWDRIANDFANVTFEFSQIGSDPVSSSMGMRVELWKASWSAFMDSAWFGYGQIHNMQSVIPHLSDLVSYIRFTHLHNVWVDSAVSGGILGVVAVSAVFLSPVLNVFGKNLAKNDARLDYIIIFVSLVGILNSLFNTLFTHDIMSVVYLLPILVVMACQNPKARA